MKKFEMIVFFLLCLGGLNWGLIGLFDFNLVNFIVGESWVDRVIYFFIGVAAVKAVFSKKSRKK
jgi:uncharacterized protein